MIYGTASDIEMAQMTKNEAESWSEPLNWATPVDIRLGFIRKVFGILTAQLMLTVFVAGAIIRSTSLKAIVHHYPNLLMIVLVANVAVCLAFVCGPERWRRQVPINYALLFAFTLTEGIIVGFICSQYQVASVLTALMCTSALVGGLTVYAWQKTTDFTGFGPYLVAGTWGMLIAGVFVLLAPANPVFNNLYCALGIVLFSFYLIYDIQIVIGGDHAQFQLSVDDYVFGAMMLYMDIIQLFLYILRLVGQSNSD